jgi:biopolymer transport protein ExbD
MHRFERRTNIGFNMAPMIDVVFQLLIFFSLVSTFAAAETVLLELPNPERSQARNVKMTDKVVINCRPAAGDEEASGVLYSIGPNVPESLERISERLAAAAAVNPQLKVIIRADKRLSYEKVRCVMQIVADNRIENMSLVAHVAPGET